MDKLSIDTLKDNLKALTVMLQLIAGLYKKYLNVDLIECLKSTTIDDEQDIFCHDEECRCGLKLMCDYCASNDIADLILQSKGDHSQLFIGPVKLLAPPWSSIYLDSQRLLWGPTSIEVEEKLKSFGFSVPEGNSEPWDHIAYELQFVADLNKKALEYLDQDNNSEGYSYLDAVKGFIDNYISPWLSEFTSLVEKNAETNFYRGLAKLTRGAVRLELDLLTNILHPLQCKQKEQS
jgi:TorA maturation chaperone TorD